MHQLILTKTLLTFLGETQTFKYMVFFELVDDTFTWKNPKILTTAKDGFEDETGHRVVAEREVRRLVEGNRESLQKIVDLASQLELNSNVASLAARLESKWLAYEGGKKVVFEKALHPQAQRKFQSHSEVLLASCASVDIGAGRFRLLPPMAI